MAGPVMNQPQGQWCRSDLCNLLKLVRNNDDQLKQQACADMSPMNDNGLQKHLQHQQLDQTQEMVDADFNGLFEVPRDPMAPDSKLSNRWSVSGNMSVATTTSSSEVGDGGHLSGQSMRSNMGSVSTPKMGMKKTNGNFSGTNGNFSGSTNENYIGMSDAPLTNTSCSYPNTPNPLSSTGCFSYNGTPSHGPRSGQFPSATRQNFLSNATQWEFPQYNAQFNAELSAHMNGLAANHCQQDQSFNNSADPFDPELDECYHVQSTNGVHSANGVLPSANGVQSINGLASITTEWEWHCDDDRDLSRDHASPLGTAERTFVARDGDHAQPPGITFPALAAQPYVAEDLPAHGFQPRPQSFNPSHGNVVQEADPMFMAAPMPVMQDMNSFQSLPQMNQPQFQQEHSQQKLFRDAPPQNQPQFPQAKPVGPQNQRQFQQPVAMMQAPMPQYQHMEQCQMPAVVNAQAQQQCVPQHGLEFQDFQDFQEMQDFDMPLQEFLDREPIQGDGKEKTLMIRGIPCSLTQEEMMKMLDDAGFAGQYNFFYMPRFQVNLGYAFVNFLEASSAMMFKRAFDGRRLNPKSSEKVCTVSPAHIQGTAKLKKLFRRKRRRAPFFCDESKPDN
jgi:hypothetical protein